MSDVEKHLRIAQEKLSATSEAYAKHRNTVVGDLAIKVVEQLIEADAARNGGHFGTHYDRQAYANRTYPQGINAAMRKIWFAYGDLGYDGTDGRRAALVMQNLKLLVEFIEKRMGVRLWGSAGS